MTASALEVVRQKVADGDFSGADAALAGLLGSAAQAPVEALVISASLLRRRGKLEEALAAIEPVLGPDSTDVSALLEHAMILREMHEHDRALDQLSHILYLDPKHPRAHTEMGRIHRVLADFPASIDFFRRALDLDPSQVDAWLELGWVLMRQRKHAEALDAFEKVLEFDPENLAAHNNLALVVARSENYERARDLLEKLCTRVSASTFGPWLNLANALHALGDFDRPRRIYDRILRAEPNHTMVRWNRSHLLLCDFDYQNGWIDYEARLLNELSRPPRLIPWAPWKGEPLEGKTLLVVAEQGLGDQIMFASCLSHVFGDGRRVVLECEKRLANLFARSFPQAEVVASGQQIKPSWLGTIGAVDYQINIGSLAGMFRRRLEDFPQGRGGYLSASPEQVTYWRERLATLGPGAKVGLSWRGGTPGTRSRLRSLALDELRPLLEVPGCQFVSLQYGKGVIGELDEFRERTGLVITHWPEAIDDYDETAALCCALDLTVSVCTSVIHLNGALGRPVWILTPSSPEWRYGSRGERMPWYPSVTLIRQTALGTWDDAVARIERDLSGFVVEGAFGDAH